ncbi:hypothetical protein ANN_06981 [Periplaneta americana]|uniref:Uncharacterized protein n=1 Tax=Periplaneta americana TaxID=6978 RepID=A0ABQ8TF43_PERAM|nr:hypothetical protein ANN_06981 [Periplaneta americana]
MRRSWHSHTRGIGRPPARLLGSQHFPAFLHPVSSDEAEIKKQKQRRLALAAGPSNAVSWEEREEAPPTQFHSQTSTPRIAEGGYSDSDSIRITSFKEHRLRVFENKVLRKIFGAKRDEITGEWRKLHNTELHALYSSPDIIRNIKSRRLRWAGHVARMGESRNAYSVLVGRPEGKRPLGRPRRRWEDNIKMNLRELGYDDRDWINLAQDRDRWRAYVRAAMNLRVP